MYADTNYTATESECYDWLVDSILYALEHRRWTKEDSHIYNDKNGPDKAINRKLKHTRINHLVATNRQKRQINLGLASTDGMEEEYGQVYSASAEDSELASILDNDIVKNTINMLWERKDYFKAFLLDCIVNSNCFSRNKQTNYTEFNRKLAVRYFKNLSQCLEFFSSAYDIEMDEVLSAFNYINRLTPTDIYGRIDTDLKQMRKLFDKEELLKSAE